MANATTRKEEERTGFMNPAGDKMKKAEHAGAEAADKAKDAVKAGTEALGEAADAGAAAVGGGLKSLAGAVRDHGPHEGPLGNATTAVAKGLEKGGKYLQQEGLSGIADDVTEMIRRNPIPAVLVGVGIGFLLAQLIRS
jgi:hypothetical protein